MKEGVLKKRIVSYVLICRLIILLSLIFLAEIGGFTKIELQHFFYLLIPLSCVYFAFVLKFILNNRYILKGKTIPNNYFLMGYPLLIAAYLLEMLLILAKALFNVLDNETMFTIVIGLECFLAVHCGWYLSYIFAKEISEPIADAGKTEVAS